MWQFDVTLKKQKKMKEEEIFCIYWLILDPRFHLMQLKSKWYSRRNCKHEWKWVRTCFPLAFFSTLGFLMLYLTSQLTWTAQMEHSQSDTQMISFWRHCWEITWFSSCNQGFFVLPGYRFACKPVKWVISVRWVLVVISIVVCM